MSTGIEHLFVQSGTLLKVTRNRFGNRDVISQTVVNCRFREADELVSNVGRETIDSQAMLWLPYDTDVSTSDLFQINGNQYTFRIIRKARRGGEVAINFLKCDMERYSNNVS